MTEFDDKHVPEFLKDKKKLNIAQIDSDLKRFEKVFLVTNTKLTGLKQISGLQRKGVKTPIYKVKKFRCKALNKGSRSGIRIIFAYIEDEDKVIYIEIYKKNKKKNNDEKRILKYFKEG